jgi:head-tail adaptor
MVVACEQLPNSLRVCFSSSGTAMPNAEFIQANALTVKHTQQVMIRLQQELSRVSKRSIVSKPSRVSMAMRTDNRQVSNLLIQLSCYVSLPGAARE